MEMVTKKKRAEVATPSRRSDLQNAIRKGSLFQDRWDDKPFDIRGPIQYNKTMEYTEGMLQMADQELLKAMRQMLQEELAPIRKEQASIREEITSIKQRLEIVETKLDAVGEAVVQNSLKISEIQEMLKVMTSVIKTNSFDIAWLKSKVS